MTSDEQSQYNKRFGAIKEIGQNLEDVFGKEISDRLRKISSETIKKTRAAGKLGKPYKLTAEQFKVCQTNGFGTYVPSPEQLEKRSKTWFKKEQTPWNKGLKGDEYVAHFKQGFSNQTGNRYNHKVTKIEFLDLDAAEDVYDLTVENYHNFAIDAGIFVHNCNICIMYAGMPAITFSVTRAGDFIDENVARDTGTPSAKAQYMKEKGEVDLSNPTLLVSNGTATLQTNVPKSEIAQAIKSYYVVLINYLLANIIKQFETSKDVPTFPIPVPFVIGGGTALVPGFIDLFKEQLAKQPFPIDISEVRLAEDAHIAVANGCLKEADLNVN